MQRTSSPALRRCPGRVIVTVKTVNAGNKHLKILQAKTCMDMTPRPCDDAVDGQEADRRSSYSRWEEPSYRSGADIQIARENLSRRNVIGVQPKASTPVTATAAKRARSRDVARS